MGRRHLADDWLGYNMSVAVAVGFIGLVGIAAETGMVMLAFLDQAFKSIAEKHHAAGEKVTVEDLYAAVAEGAITRIRAVMMTIAGSILGLLLVMLSNGYRALKSRGASPRRWSAAWSPRRS